MKLSKKLINEIEKAGFGINKQTDDDYYFSKNSPAGQDFGFEVKIGDSLEEFGSNVLNFYDAFDVSEETYYWLDSFGHGTNGAPYDMRDLYEDMEVCASFIFNLYEIIRDYQVESAR